jgi:SAM dependent carboxyl methyltransferase
MTEATPAVAPAPMEGHGAYNRSSRVQAAGAAPAIPLLEQAAREAALPPTPEPIVVADYGSSEGHNSLAPMGLAIHELRRRAGPQRAISVVHTDLPGNDFSAMFQMLAADPESYLRGDSMVFPAAVGRSFYDQILPAGSVTLGWSSWAAQWLSRLPVPIPDHIQVTFSEDAAARDAFARLAAEDWRRFLIHRGAELRPGGRLVILTMALDAEGRFGYEPVMKAMYGALLALQAEGFVGQEEVGRMGVPTVGRSRDELRAPFGPEGRLAGLSIAHLQVFHGEDRIWAAYAQSRDATAFGARWAAFSRASVFPTLAAELDGGASDPRAAAFIDRLEAGMAARLAAAPEQAMIPLARMLLVKD